MQLLEEWETSQLAVISSSIMYLQLTPVMRNVLTMSTKGKKKREEEEEGEQDGSRMTLQRLMLEMTVSTCVYKDFFFKGK